MAYISQGKLLLEKGNIMSSAYYKINNFLFKITYEEKITGIKLVDKKDDKDKKTPKTDILYQELIGYFKGELKNFTVDFDLKGSDFQKKVWKELLKIPYGKTSTYKKISENLSTKAYRAVGSAIGKNPLVIVIPCHRVIKTDGSIGGFFYGTKVKKMLLDIEKSKS